MGTETLLCLKHAVNSFGAKYGVDTIMLYLKCYSNPFSHLHIRFCPSPVCHCTQNRRYSWIANIEVNFAEFRELMEHPVCSELDIKAPTFYRFIPPKLCDVNHRLGSDPRRSRRRSVLTHFVMRPKFWMMTRTRRKSQEERRSKDGVGNLEIDSAVDMDTEVM